jgi:hypothetical protein
MYLIVPKWHIDLHLAGWPSVGIGLKRFSLASDNLAFDHFEVTLVVMTTTATGNWTNMHERLICRRFQRSCDHL